MTTHEPLSCVSILNMYVRVTIQMRLLSGFYAADAAEISLYEHILCIKRGTGDVFTC